MNMWVKVSTTINLMLKCLFLDGNRVLVIFLDDFYFQLCYLLIFML